MPTRAQRAGAVRNDVDAADAADVKALVTGCLARERASADPEARQRMRDVVCADVHPSV
ncbi:MAG TPA: hypothetical protein VG317_01010 [Pseudonocardiaceae bacterium]|nr:hypothetical protein [Pseudonocardiaceae bacterium]